MFAVDEEALVVFVGVVDEFVVAVLVPELAVAGVGVAAVAFFAASAMIAARSAVNPAAEAATARVSCFTRRRPRSRECVSFEPGLISSMGSGGAETDPRSRCDSAETDGGELAAVRKDGPQELEPKSTSLVSTVPAVRPGASWYFQYRFVCAMTLSGGGAPHSV